MEEIINFYKSFSRYSCFTDESIYNETINCYNLKQYKIFKDDLNLYGFVSWAYLDNENLKYYLQTGIIDNYNCGNNLIHIDLLAKKNIKEIYKWSRKHLAEKIGIGNKTQWIRLNKENGIRNIVNKTIKDSWNG